MVITTKSYSLYASKDCETFQAESHKVQSNLIISGGQIGLPYLWRFINLPASGRASNKSEARGPKLRHLARSSGHVFMDVLNYVYVNEQNHSMTQFRLSARPRFLLSPIVIRTVPGSNETSRTEQTRVIKSH